MNIKDKTRVEHMLSAINDIEIFAENGERDAKTQAAIERKIEILGEAANAISKELKEQYSDIPWSNIIGMRHYLIHEYFRVEDETLWDVVEHRIPALKNWLEGILEQAK